MGVGCIEVAILLIGLAIPATIAGLFIYGARTIARAKAAEAAARHARGERALAAVRLHRGDPAVKTVALFIGRLSYAAGRPDRQPTLYDEQAIANDIAAQSP